MMIDIAPVLLVMGGLTLFVIGGIVFFAIGEERWMREHKGKGDRYITPEDKQ